MLAMTLLLLDFVALPVLAVVLAVLLVVYYRRWSAWKRQAGGSARKGA